MTSKQIWVNIKEARLLDQWLNTTIASARWSDLLDIIWGDMKVIEKAREELKNSELYNTVWKDIEAKAHELVDTKCKPEWNRISEEMKPLGEERNRLAKEKAEAKEWEWLQESEDKLTGIDKQLSDLSNEYQKVTNDANAELNAYKEERINSEQWAAFFLSEKDYKIVGWYVWF